MGSSKAVEEVGRVVDGRFRLEEYLGGGAMGDVFRARHLKIGRTFAIKLLHPHLVADPKVLARFEREAHLAAKLRHPNLVPVLDAGDVDGRAFLVMELAVGDTLAALLDSRVVFERGRAIRIIGQLCDGLAYAHELGLVHRDLKPENVIVETTAAGEVARIVDFGLALVRDPGDGAAEERRRLTTGGFVLGSPHYISPEVATGAAFDHRADLFALGVICFEMLTGRMPFDGAGVDVVHANVLSQTPPMGVRVPGLAVDPLLEAFTRKLMEKQPGDRPASAADARRLLELVERDPDAAALELGVERPRATARAVSMAPTSMAMAMPPAPAPAPRAARRWRLVAAGALAVACASLALVARTTLVSRATDKPATTAAAIANAPTAREVEPPPPAPVAIVATADVRPAPPVAIVPPPRASVPPARASITARVPHATPPVVPIATPQPAHPVALGLEACSDRSMSRPPPPPNAIVSRYVEVGRALKQLGDAAGADELWQRYRLIRIADALGDDPSTLPVRARTVALLDDIQRQIDRRPR